jgi:DHA1 family inner membrane transport protein
MAAIQTGTPGDSDDPNVIAAVVAIAAIISATLLAAPGVVGALISGPGFEPSQAGYTISIEQACMSLAALPALWWMEVYDWGAIVRRCLVAMVIGNLLCATVHSFPTLALLRGLIGLAGGSVMAVCLAVVGTSQQRERNFAFWAIGQLVVGAIALFLLPRVPAIYRAKILFVVLAALILALLPKAPRLARPAVASRQESTQGPFLGTGALAALGAVFAFYVAIGGVWTYVERIGLQDGLAAPVVANDLAVASLFGIAGCLSAAWLRERIGRSWPMCVGYTILLAATWMLSKPITPLAFATSAFAFLYAWTFSLPFLLAVVASRDRTGRLSVLINLMIGAGLGFGPAVFAAMLKDPPDYRLTLPIAIIAGVLSLCLAMAANRRQEQQ